MRGRIWSSLAGEELAMELVRVRVASKEGESPRGERLGE
jgi:hypothetical protein